MDAPTLDFREFSLAIFDTVGESDDVSNRLAKALCDMHNNMMLYLTGWRGKENGHTY